MPRFLIHVGPHKTGTTYLQLRFAAAAGRLRARGVVYPGELQAGRTEPSHRKLFLAVREANPGYLQSVFEQIDRLGAGTVLLSTEDISHFDRRELGLLRDAIGRSRATIIYYCRRWSELLPSVWQERVKHGYDETFPEFLAAQLGDPLASPLLNFTHALDAYASVFGRENLRIVSYSNVCDAGRDLAAHFFATFLPEHQSVLDGLPPCDDPRPNRSLPSPLVEVIRALNAFHAEAGGARNAALRDWYMAHADQFDLSAAFTAIAACQDALRFSDASPAVERLQQEVLARYRDCLVEPLSEGRLFEPHAADIAFIRPRYLVHPGVEAALARVYAGYRAAAGRPAA